MTDPCDQNHKKIIWTNQKLTQKEIWPKWEIGPKSKFDLNRNLTQIEIWPKSKFDTILKIGVKQQQNDLNQKFEWNQKFESNQKFE